MPTTRHRYIELDSLRGLAAGTVVLHHLSYVFHTTQTFKILDHSPLRVLGAGHEAVILFFLLSGFVLSVPFSRPDAPGYLAYIVKRICRIYLPYLAAVGLALLGAHFLYTLVPTGNNWIDGTWSQRPTPRLVLQHLILLKQFDYAQLNTAFWSLVFEARISIIFPALWWIANRFRHTVILPAAFAITMLCAALSERLGHPDFWLTFLYSAFFLVGIVLFKRLPAISARLRRVGPTVRGLLIANMLLCFYLPETMRFPLGRIHGLVTMQMYLREWVILAGASGCMIAALEWQAFRHLLHRPALLRLGQISFSMYLVHGTLLFALIRAFHDRLNIFWLAPVYLIGTYLAAEAFHFCVERPSIALGRHMAKRLSRTRAPKPSEVTMA